MNDTIEELRKSLNEGLVIFSYNKLNGDYRKATGTTVPSIITEHQGPLPKGNKPKNLNVINYYDIDSEGWRSCSVDKVIEIIKKIPIRNKQVDLKFD